MECDKSEYKQISERASLTQPRRIGSFGWFNWMFKAKIYTIYQCAMYSKRQPSVLWTRQCDGSSRLRRKGYNDRFHRKPVWADFQTIRHIISNKRKHRTKWFTQCTMDREIGPVCITKIDAACGVDNERLNGAARDSRVLQLHFRYDGKGFEQHAHMISYFPCGRCYCVRPAMSMHSGWPMLNTKCLHR